MISIQLQQCCTFVGARDEPEGPGGNLQLFHGALITVYQLGFVERICCTHDELLADRWEWRDPDRIPRHSRSGGVCLLTAEDRWFLHIRNFPGCTLMQAAEQCLGASSGSVTLGSARSGPIDDLCLQGEPCRGVIFACHTPPPVSSPPAASAREDNFIFLDFRQVGCRPYGMYQASDCWFIPALLARFPFQVPPEYALGLEGGHQEGAYLFAASGTTLRARLVYVGPDAAVAEPACMPDSSFRDSADTGSQAEQAAHSTNHSQDASRNETSTDRSRSPRRTHTSSEANCKVQKEQYPENKGTLTPNSASLQKLTSRDRHGEMILLSSLSAVEWSITLSFEGSLGKRLLKEIQLHQPGLLRETVPATFLPLTCKFLSEPTPQNMQDRRNLDVLRAMAPRFGQAWRYVPPSDAEEILLAPSDVESDSEEEAQIPLTLHFAIAKPGYWLERVAVTTTLPADLDEVIDAVQEERNEAYFQTFPFLLDVTPQPCQGSGFLLACPLWNPDVILVCLDTSLLDGRIFAAESPAYASRQQFLVMADVPPGLDIRVYVSADPDPIDDDAWVHVIAGMRIAFVPAGETFVFAQSLGQSLLTASSWSPNDTIPYPGQCDAYCLVGHRETILCLHNSMSPANYRQHIARDVGISESHLRLFPAKPRIYDAALNGLPCTTVMAFEDADYAASRTLCAILLDARPILQGWHMLFASLDDIAATCLDDLFRGTPS